MRRHFNTNERTAAFFLICTMMGTVACTHRQELGLKTYVNDALGLREDAPVRVQGVDLGKVTTVRVLPDGKRPPVEIDMVLQPNYDLRIPADAKVRLETQGVLGPTFADIDLVGASGPPVADRGVLQAQEQHRETMEELVSKISKSLRKPCKDGADPTDPAVSPKSPATRR